MASEKALKIKSASRKKPSRSALGAPSQHNQSSRKGKKAWRKNVDIGEVEQGLEGLRQEERVTGTILQKLKDSDLFTVDLTGDEQIRNSMPRYSAAQLTSTKILAQRSAVPAVFSRITTTIGKRKHGLSREEKDRLMRIAKRPRKGPFNSIMDPSEYAAGSATVALSAAVKNSGKYDPWVSQPVNEVKDGLETVQEKKIKPPVLFQPRDLINVPAIVEPHQGTSYNPPVDAHQELLLKAGAVEEKRLKGVEKLAAVKAKMDSAVLETDGLNSLGAAGMTVTAQIDSENTQEEEGEEADGQGLSLPKIFANRKTKTQKNKAARVLAEKRALIQRTERKRLLASVSSAKQFRKSNTEFLSIREEEREQKQLALAEKLRKQGLAGQKLGKHKVPESELAVQLGEDLSESLRGLKPEGNLFRDRFQSLQQRALIEPRALVLPKKRRHKMVEYEKHAWKRFE